MVSENRKQARGSCAALCVSPTLAPACSCDHPPPLQPVPTDPRELEAYTPDQRKSIAAFGMSFVFPHSQEREELIARVFSLEKKKHELNKRTLLPVAGVERRGVGTV